MSYMQTRPLLAACIMLCAFLQCLPASAGSAWDWRSAPAVRLQAWVGHWHTK